MIDRLIHSALSSRLVDYPVVAVLGARQVGKTLLARSLKIDKPTVYLDLERPSDLTRLSDPELYLGGMQGTLVILDEIQRLPELFPLLRSLVDERRQAGENAGHFLLLGSASPQLLRQGSETLAGRISYIELDTFVLPELGYDADTISKRWMRGGFPLSLLARSDAAAMKWCSDFLTSYVERYLPEYALRTTPAQLRRLCTMLAHQQACSINLASIGNALGIDGKTVRSYIALLEALYLLRRIPSWNRNVGKRLVKAPKVQWRDSGLVHSLLGLPNLDHVLGHPICGHSWEAFCSEQIISLLPAGASYSYYHTHAGAEVDLVIEFTDGRIHAIEIKRTLSPKLRQSFIESMTTIGATQGYFITPSGTSFPLAENVQALSLAEYITKELPGLY